MSTFDWRRERPFTHERKGEDPYPEIGCKCGNLHPRGPGGEILTVAPTEPGTFAAAADSLPARDPYQAIMDAAKEDREHAARAGYDAGNVTRRIFDLADQVNTIASRYVPQGPDRDTLLRASIALLTLTKCLQSIDQEINR